MSFVNEIAFKEKLNTLQIDGNLEVGGDIDLKGDFPLMESKLQTKTDVTATNTLNANLSSAIGLKANQTAVDTLETTLETKASKQDVDAMEANINTALETKATQVFVDALETNINTALETKANQADVDTAMNLKANQSDVDTINTTLDTKANQADVDTALNAKANQAHVDAMEANINTALELKANQADVDTAMNAKANQADVDTMEANINTALETKANQTDVDAKANQADIDTMETNINTALDTKANQTYVDTMEANINTALETKANQADVNTALDTKASKDELDAVVSASQPAGNYLTHDDLETAVGASAGAGAGAGLITAGTTIWTGTTSTGQSVVRTFGNWLTGIKSGYDALNDGFGLEEEADIVEEFNLSRYVEKPSDFTGDLKGYVEGKVSSSVLKPSDWLETDNLDTYVTMKTENIDGGAEISGSGAYLKITDRDVAGTGMPGIYFLRGENGGTFGSSPAMDWSITADINGLNVSRKSTDPNGIFSYDGSILELKESGIVNIPKADGLKINNEVVAVKNQHYTIDQVNTFLSGKADVGVSYTKAESDTNLGVKANSVDVYNRTQADNRFQPVGEYALTSQIPDISGLATTTSLSEGLASKQPTGDYALSSQIPDVSGFATTTALNEGLATKADASTLNNYTPTLALTPLLDAKAPQSSTYTKTEVDTKLADYTLTADLPAGVDTSGLVPFSPTYVAPENVSWSWTINATRPDISGNPVRYGNGGIPYTEYLTGNPSLETIINAFKYRLGNTLQDFDDLTQESVVKNEFDGKTLIFEFSHNWEWNDFDFNIIVFNTEAMRTKLGINESYQIKHISTTGDYKTWKLEIPMNPIIDNLEDEKYMLETENIKTNSLCVGGRSNQMTPLHISIPDTNPRDYGGYTNVPINMKNDMLRIGNRITTSGPYYNNEYGIQFGVSGSGNGSIQTYNYGDQYSTIGANYNLLLQPNGGNVGIGKTEVGDTLDVYGGIRGTRFWENGNNIGTDAALRTLMEMSSGDIGLLFLQSYAAGYYMGYSLWFYQWYAGGTSASVQRILGSTQVVLSISGSTIMHRSDGSSTRFSRWKNLPLS